MEQTLQVLGADLVYLNTTLLGQILSTVCVWQIYWPHLRQRLAKETMPTTSVCQVLNQNDLPEKLVSCLTFGTKPKKPFDVYLPSIQAFTEHTGCTKK